MIKNVIINQENNIQQPISHTRLSHSGGNLNIMGKKN